MIVEATARLIIKEYKHNPNLGRVLLLGRQTVALTLNQFKDICLQEGVDLSERILDKSNTNLIDSDTRYSKNKEYITDYTFFELLGASSVKAMDVDAYEAADIIHNLNFPISDNLKGKFDFIIDGGTFDHLFDFKTAFSNLTELLSENGRVIMWNGASNFTGGAYISFAPDFFLDYFLVNKYADCKVFCAELFKMGQLKNWRIFEFLGGRSYVEGPELFTSPILMMTIVVAQRSPESTTSFVPVQSFYRNDDLWETYEQQKSVFAKSDRAFSFKKKGSLMVLVANYLQGIPRIIKYRIQATTFKFKGFL